MFYLQLAAAFLAGAALATAICAWIGGIAWQVALAHLEVVVEERERLQGIVRRMRARRAGE